MNQSIRDALGRMGHDEISSYVIASESSADFEARINNFLGSVNPLRIIDMQTSISSIAFMCVVFYTTTPKKEVY